MSWQAIDFQRIVVLDQSLVQQLDHYLQDKEAELGQEILTSFPTGKEGIAPPMLEPSKLLRLKLSDAIEGFSKRVRQAIQREEELVNDGVLKHVRLKVEEGFLNYVEVLEGCVRELFLQVDQTGLDGWTSDLLMAIDFFKDLFHHHIEDSILVLKRLENLLKEYRRACREKEGGFLVVKALADPFLPVLDSSLISNLERLEKYLKSSHKKCSRYLVDYLQIEDQVNISLKKLNSYHALEKLEEVQREKYKRVYFYAKLGQMNARPKPSFFQELMRALSHTVSVEYALEIFRDYVKALYGAHYHQSRVLKKEKVRYLSEPGGKDKINEIVKGYRSEILSLGSTVARYRELILKTDPNPYVGTKWGFTEGIVAPEPQQTKQLLELEFEVENLKKLNDQIKAAVAKAESSPQPPEKIPFDPGVHKMLHEMGQPLTTYGMVKGRAEKLLEHLSEINELGSTNPNAIEYTGDTLSKMLRADWKFHILHEIPLFQEIIKNHFGITGDVEERRHLNRMNKFSYVTKELELWVTRRETRKHEREIEFDVNDLKVYLQDFLGLVQRASQEEGEAPVKRQKVYDLAHLLLIYRNLFGEFFHHLENASLEGRRLRQKLLFVDQYFESADQKLYEMKSSL